MCQVDQCGYKEFEIDCGENNHCDGYDINCPMYTTHGHVLEFQEMFEFDKDLESLVKRCDLRLKKYYENIYGEQNEK